MPFSTYHTIRKFNDTGYEWTLKARIISIWPAMNLTSKNIVGLNMLMVDETNTRIQGFAGLKDYQKVEETITCGRIYTITNFSVKKYGNETFTRPICSDYRLFLSNYTKFEEATENETLIPHFAFDLYPLTDVEKLAAQTLYLTDIIGVVSEVKMTHNLPEKTFVPFFISDGRYTVKVLFWNEVGERFLEQLKKATENPVIIIISCCKAQNRSGDIHFSNTPATKFFINCDHYIVRMLREQLSELPLPVFSLAEPGEQSTVPLLYNIADLEKFNIIMLNKDVKLNVTFTEYSLDNKWCERVCTKCQKPVHKIDGKRRCVPCNKTVTYPHKRYRVIATAVDITGTATILLLDREVKKIVGKDILQLEAEYSDDEEDENDSQIPDILKRLLQREFTLTVQITENNLTAGDTVYTCSRVEETLDTTMIISSGDFSPNVTANKVVEMCSGYSGQARGTDLDPSTEWSSTKDRVIWMTNNLLIDSDNHSVANDSNIPLMNIETLTGLQVFDIPPEVSVKCYEHVAAIPDLDRWFTENCVICGHSLFVRDIYLYCTSCTKIVYYPLRRLSIRVYVHDDMSTALFHLNHDVVQKLIPSAVHYLPRGQLHNAPTMPLSFLNVIGKKYMFVIKTKIANLRGECCLWSCIDVESVQ